MTSNSIQLKVHLKLVDLNISKKIYPEKICFHTSMNLLLFGTSKNLSLANICDNLHFEKKVIHRMVTTCNCPYSLLYKSLLFT